MNTDNVLMRARSRDPRRARLIFAAPLIIGHVHAFALTSAQGEPAEGVTVLEEVMVTAERTAQNVQDVSIAATVLSGAQLDEQGINRIDDLQRVAPSMSLSNIGRSTSINIRGVGLLQTSPTSSPDVAYYINGVLIPHENSLLGSFYDVQSVEVLRGPQGTLAGQNSTGGAIFFRTTAPAFGKWSGYVDQTVADYDWHRTVGAVNVPLGEVVAARVAGVYDVRDSFTTNTGSASQPGDLNYSGARADLAFRPVESLSANLRYEYSRSDNDNFAYQPFSAASGADPFVIAEDAISYNVQTGSRWDGELRYDLTPTLQARWISSRQRNDNDDLSDTDRSASLPTRGLGGVITSYRIWTHELNLISSGNETLDWVAGAFYLTDDATTRLLGYSTSAVVPLGQPTSNSYSETQTQSKSLFAQATYTLAPTWKLVAGARYSWDHQERTRLSGLPPFALGKSSTESAEPTGRVALNWEPADATLVYASLAKGYKAGGNNLLSSDPAFAPEKNRVAELGAKTEFMDRHLRVNTAVFTSDYDNIQVGSGHFVSGSPLRWAITQNSGKARSYGAELELAAVFDGLRMNASAAYLHSRTRADISLINVDHASAIEVAPSGTTLPFAPEWTLNAGVEYEFALPVGSLTPRVQVAHSSVQYATLFPSALTRIDSRNVWDARLTYRPDDAWRIEGFVTNFTDATYVAAINQGGTNAAGGRVYGAPRQVGLRLNLSFD